MDVVILQVFVSLFLVVGSVLLFAFTCRQHDFEHADRLALLPLEAEGRGAAADAPEPAIPAGKHAARPMSAHHTIEGLPE